MARTARGTGVEFRPARPEDVLEMSAYIRGEDRDECWLAAQIEPETGLFRALESATHAWTAWDGTLPVTIFGVSPISALTGVGSPWLIGTDALVYHSRALLVDGRRYLAEMRATYPRLENMVSAQNHTAVRWLQWLGFHVEHPIRYGPYGALFCPFWIGPAPEGGS